MSPKCFQSKTLAVLPHAPHLVKYFHGNGADVVDFEDEHPPIFAPVCDDPTCILNEAPMMSESDLHSSINDLSNQHQILGDRGHMQKVPPNSSLAKMAQRDISDMFDRVGSVVSSHDDSWLLRLCQSREPFLTVCHMVLLIIR